MKKILIICIVLLQGIYFEGYTQTNLGIKSGVNIPKLTGGDVTSNTKNKMGVYAGVFSTIHVKENIAIQPELLWSCKGYKYQELGEFKTTFNYIHIPVLVQYRTKGFYAETGPQIGILITAKQKIESGPSESIKESFKSTAFSWGIGAGYQLPSGFGIGLRYNIGIGSISNESSIDAKFNVLMVGISKSFDVRGKGK